MANIILEIKIINLIPTLWYGQRVVDKYTAIAKVITAKIGEEYASLFAQPQLSDSSFKGLSAARWLSNDLSDKASKLTDLDELTYNLAKEELEKKLNRVKDFGNELLLSEKDENVKWGQLILKAINYPDESYIYYENGQVTITAWGFDLIDSNLAVSGYSRNYPTEESEASQILDKPEKEEVTRISNSEEVPEEFIKEEVSHENIDYPITAGGTVAQDNFVNKEQLYQDEEKGKQDGRNPEVRSEGKKNLQRFWPLLLVLLLMLLLGPYFLCAGKSIGSSDNNPSDPSSSFEPIAPEKIIASPDSITNIVSDRLNIVLHGNNKDIETFCSDFKRIYPSSEYKIISKNSQIPKIQVQVPGEELENLKNSLESKMSGYQLLIWHESIFQKNTQFNDPGFNDPKKSWYFDEVQAKESWDITQGDEAIIIAILDSGFDLNHPEMKDKVYKPWDVTTLSSNIKYHSDHSIHGTHVASISAGNSNNNSGVSGIAPNCKIMPVKVSDENGTIGSSYVVDGLLYAINNGADVVNMSLGLYVNPMVEFFPEEVQKDIIRNSFKDEEEFWKLLFNIALENKTAVVLAGGNQNLG